MNTQKGFTLIELMISVVIGLIIIAAAGQVYVMAIRTGSSQKAAANILDSNVYGLQQIERHLRMAGLGLSENSELNKVCSGILIAKDATSLTQCALLTGVDNKSPITKLPLDLWTNVSNVTSNSVGAEKLPQLTIQYRAPEDMSDCEGRLALGPREVRGQSVEHTSFVAGQNDTDIRIGGQVVVERYFVKRNGDNLELRCDAGRYVPEWIKSEGANADKSAIIGVNSSASDMKNALLAATVHNMSDDGVLMISDLDHFDLLLGVNEAHGFRYYNINDYLANAPGNIVSVKIGILAKGSVATKQDANQPVQTDYVLLDHNIKLSGTQASGALRRVYESATTLRNSRGNK